MVIPQGCEVVVWCSLLCNGNPATGNLVIHTEDGTVTIPVCDECGQRAEQIRLDSTLEE